MDQPAVDAAPRKLTVVIALSAVPLGITGHAGVAVGEQYWDFGPQRVEIKQRLRGLGSPAGPWWDDPAQRWGRDRALSGVLADLPELVHPEGSRVVVMSAWVTAGEAARVEQYWTRTYAAMADGSLRYELTHRQCSSVGCHSLGGVAGLPGFLNVTADPSDLPPQVRAMTPTALYLYLRVWMRHTAGPDAGDPADVQRLVLRGGRLRPVGGPFAGLLGR